jgi:dihydrofolate reductase
MIASVFVGTSVDGFIARHNGALDFLPEGGGEPRGYTEFMASVDALIIGRNTFDVVAAFAEWPYGGKRVVVLSSRAVNFSTVKGGARADRRRDSALRRIAARCAAAQRGDSALSERLGAERIPNWAISRCLVRSRRQCGL